MSRLRKNNKSEGGGAPGWMTTFSDMMSLLLTFFILLYSMSTVDEVKFGNVTASLHSIFSGSSATSIFEGDGGRQPIDGLGQLDSSNKIDIEKIKKIEEMEEQVSEYIEKSNLNGKVSVQADTRGVYVDINETILFESGKADLKESGIKVLKELKGLFKEFDNEIVVEGHTDNVPINRPLYPTNWELSTARAVSVVRYLAEKENIDPRRLSAVGYGEYRPIVDNDTSKNRALNRRVNILIVFEEEGDGQDGGKQ